MGWGLMCSGQQLCSEDEVGANVLGGNSSVQRMRWGVVCLEQQLCSEDVVGGNVLGTTAIFRGCGGG